MDIPAILTKYLPGAQWKIGETYESLIMLDETPKPTKAQLQFWWDKYLRTKRKSKAEQEIILELETALQGATVTQKNKLLARLIARIATKEEMQQIIGVDPTEPDG